MLALWLMLLEVRCLDPFRPYEIQEPEEAYYRDQCATDDALDNQRRAREFGKVSAEI